METKNSSTLLKIGEDIIFSTCGLDYELKNGQVYTAEWDYGADRIKLKESSALQLPNKLYITNEDEKFMNRVLTHFNKSEKSTGVMLAGTKGTGKTVLAKQIAIRSDLPILTIDKSLHPRYLKNLFEKLENVNMCIVIDEIDKLGENYDDSFMLQVFDGISASGKHLILTTCNNTDNVNEYLLDRCSRIRYYRTFEEMSQEMVKNILDDRLNDKTKAQSLSDFIIKSFACVSFDNVVSFAEEVNDYPEESYTSLFNDMNISER